jgi:tripartite-type tricarboxylate transporter receptor subunit TctC
VGRAVRTGQTPRRCGQDATIGKAMQDPATKKRYTDIKVDAVGSTAEEFDKFFREQLKFNEDIIKNANIQQD